MNACTRDRAIARHIGLAIKHTELTRESFADDVVRIYHERTPLHLRHIEFHVLQRGGDPYLVLRANAQLVFRQVEGCVRMSCELEEALVLAMPEPFRGNCLSELAERYGLLAAALPGCTAGAQVAQVGGLSCEFGEALQALAGTMADGRLDVADQAKSFEVVAQLDGLIGAALTLRQAHQKVLGGQGTSS